MTADKQYLQLRQRQKNTRIRSIKEGVIFGCKNFAAVLWDTLIGIFTKPYLEYKKRGFLGIFRGIYTVSDIGLGIFSSLILGINKHNFEAIDWII